MRYETTVSTHLRLVKTFQSSLLTCIRAIASMGLQEAGIKEAGIGYEAIRFGRSVGSRQNHENAPNEKKSYSGYY